MENIIVSVHRLAVAEAWVGCSVVCVCDCVSVCVHALKGKWLEL